MIKRIFAALLILTLSLSLFACGGKQTDTKDSKSIEQIPMPSYKRGQKVTLNVYNWGEYISDGSEDSYDTNKEFERYFNENLSEKYGGIEIKVEYSTYPTNEDMYSKLKNSAVSYDVIIPSDYMIEKLRKEDMLLAFDTSSLSNYKNIEESFKNAYYDPENKYSVPYTYGMVGIIYNKTMVSKEDVDKQSWGLLWDEKYAGNILQFNNPRDAFATAMYWKGLDINSEDSEVWDEALKLLEEQKPILQGYVNDEIFNKMKSESAAIAAYYVGDFLTMVEEQENLGFYYPKEGSNYFVDAMCIPKCSSNPHLAKEYINFMIGEEAGVANATYLGYASPNTAVQNNDEYIEAMSDYAYEGDNGENAYDLLYNYTPDSVNAYYNSLFPDVNAPACYRSFTPEVQTQVNTLWENLKISGSTELWVHITSITIVVALLGFAGYTTYIKKKRSRDYRLRDKEKMLAKRAAQNKQ
ncbi:MAG: spermidine/putrescine ABC transporter substrate-binding protein [Ruminococcaceae bacterium]|nr:spermidine/putrescine ABC transporter substrate-binding protein [Oscillospiraceae bacterium]